jgi:SAM-dependent methyltransferase
MAGIKFREIQKIDIDSAQRTILHGEIIRSKPFLKKLYLEWYTELKKLVNYFPAGRFIELGSGGGFIKELMPDVITSDVMDLPGCDMVFSGDKMPFQDVSVDGIIMVDVFHHIPDSKSFLNEALRILKKGGVIVMSEPCNSVWSRFIYKNFHHEPFITNSGWSIPSTGPLSGANGALPWIVFERDKSLFMDLYPQFEILKIKYHTPLRYLLSGGVSYHQLVPSFMFEIISFIDHLLASKYLSMFAYYVIRKK